MTTSNSGPYLSPKYLEELVRQYQTTYRLGKPFPHVVIDNFLPTAVTEQLLDELSAMDAFDWQQLNGSLESRITGSRIGERKQRPTSQSQRSELTQHLLQQLNSAPFINFLEKLTGTEGLLANPHVESLGLQSLEPSRPFKIQVEFDRYGKPLDRKLTFLIYLNKNWKEEYGGHLELWNAEMTHCEKKILPIFNRCVIFSTTEVSYYGHPEPLDCPEDETRKLLALYYYGNEQLKARSTAMPPNPPHSLRPHPSPKEIVKLEKQPRKDLVKTFTKTFIRRLIPVLDRT